MASNTLVDKTSLLDISHLDAVLNLLKLVPKRKWQELGLKLGLLQPTLNDIETDHKGDVETCLKECLSKWLMRGDNVDEYGHPTLLRLADALEEIGDKATADKIRGSTLREKAMITFPEDLKSVYLSMNGRFATLLVDIVTTLLEETPVKKVKFFLVAFEAGASNELKQVEDDYDLIGYLRNHCHLSNLGLLETLIDNFKLGHFKDQLKKFDKEREEFYKKILAKDFAQQAIKDHEIAGTRGKISFKVKWSLRKTTLWEFEEFLTDFFDQHSLDISLHSVHCSLLTFVCTIPKRLVKTLISFVIKNKHGLKLRGVVEVIIDGIVIPITGDHHHRRKASLTRPYLPADVPLFNDQPSLQLEEYTTEERDVLSGNIYFQSHYTRRELFVRLIASHNEKIVIAVLTKLITENELSISWTLSLSEESTISLTQDLQASFQKILGDTKYFIQQQIQQQDSTSLLFQIAKEVEKQLAIEDLSNTKFSNVEELFIELEPFCNYFNFDQMEHLIQTVLIPYIDEDLMIVTSEYSKRIKYLKSSSQIRHITKAIRKPVMINKKNSNLINVTLKLHRKWMNMSLHNLSTVISYYLGFKILHFNHILPISSNNKELRVKFLVHRCQLETLKSFTIRNSENLILLGVQQMNIAGDSMFQDTNFAKEMNLEMACLQAAKKSENFSILLPLFELGVSLDCTNDDKETPLMLAVRNGRKEVVELLIALGANVRICNSKGYTALMIAYELKQDEIVEILCQVEAKANLRETGPIRQQSTLVNIPEIDEDHPESDPVPAHTDSMDKEEKIDENITVDVNSDQLEKDNKTLTTTENIDTTIMKEDNQVIQETNDKNIESDYISDTIGDTVTENITVEPDDIHVSSSGEDDTSTLVVEEPVAEEIDSPDQTESGETSVADIKGADTSSVAVATPSTGATIESITKQVDISVQSVNELTEKFPKWEEEYRHVRFTSQSLDTVNFFLLKAPNSKMNHVCFMDTVLTKNSIRELSNFITSSNSLEELELINSGEWGRDELVRLNDESVEMICRGLLKSSSVKSVSIRSCELSTDGVWTLIDMLMDMLRKGSRLKLTIDCKYEKDCDGNSYYEDEPEIKDMLYFI